MKKALFLTLGLGAVLGLASCSDDQNKSTMTYNVQSYNLVTSVDGSKDPVVAASTYKFDFDMMNTTATVGTEITGLGSSVSFVTGSIPYTGGFYYGEDGMLRELIKMESFKQGSIYNMEVQLFTPANVAPEVNGAPKISMPAMGRYLVMNYQSGDNTKVRTFWSDVTFCGTTTTTYQWEGAVKQFSNKDMKYRVVMDLQNKKATVVFYDAKFAEEMKTSLVAIELADLDLTFTQNGYTIEGKNITPSSYDNGTKVPYPGFVFDNFSLVTVGELTSTTINYEVAGKYNGRFEGSYIAKPRADQQ